MVDRSKQTKYERDDHPTQTGNIWPPPPSPDETDSEKTRRVAKEMEAKRVSDTIDQAIDLERAERRKRQADTKILLLGQAESGKSTILKNFQLVFAPKSFADEVEAWKAVIHLNLVRSVNFVLDLLEDPRPSIEAHRRSPSAGASYKKPSNDLRFLKMRLVPLRQVEQILTRRFCPETGASVSKYKKDRASEVAVRGGWKTLLKYRRNPQNPTASDDLEDAQRVIEACKDDMTLLWDHSVVQAALKEDNVRLEDQPGFFLSDVSRIASKNYTPTPDDILRARLQTIGVEEHRIVMETELERGREWLIYDVGGSRGQRAAWAPFLDDVNVIIFLAPVSVFNQSLAEDKTVNRLFDCFELWKQICGNRLLASVQFIILLNKTDVLEAKLEAGIKFSKFVPSYKGLPNDQRSVSQYLKAKYISVFQQLSSRTVTPRKLYTHLTCATDTRTTSIVLRGIRDMILMDHLTSSRII